MRVADTTHTVNDARALRIAEVMQDYHNFQVLLSGMDAGAGAHEAELIGHSTLRRCLEEGQALLVRPYPIAAAAAAGGGEASTSASPESQRRQLRASVEASPFCKQDRLCFG